MTTYHFIGIKGTGMSALAQILHDSGEKVQGSDYEKNFLRRKHLKKSRFQFLLFLKVILKKSLPLLPEMHFQMSI